MRGHTYTTSHTMQNPAFRDRTNSTNSFAALDYGYEEPTSAGSNSYADANGSKSGNPYSTVGPGFYSLSNTGTGESNYDYGTGGSEYDSPVFYSIAQPGGSSYAVPISSAYGGYAVPTKPSSGVWRKGIALSNRIDENESTDTDYQEPVPYQPASGNPYAENTFYSVPLAEGESEGDTDGGYQTVYASAGSEYGGYAVPNADYAMPGYAEPWAGYAVPGYSVPGSGYESYATMADHQQQPDTSYDVATSEGLYSVPHATRRAAPSMRVFGDHSHYSLADDYVDINTVDEA